MDSEFSDSSDDISSNQRTSKKRVKMGRERDVLKKLRATTHELGPDCKCKRYRCFENVSDEDKKRIIKEFNSLGNYNDQSKYLCGLITVLLVMRRRFTVVDCEKDIIFQNWTEYLQGYYSKKSNLKTRPIRVIEFRKESHTLMFHKDVYCGMYASTMIVPKQNKRGKKTRQNPNNENIKTNALKTLYNGKLAIKNSKYKDLLHLKQFLMKEESHKFYENLKTEEVDIQDSENEYIDNISLDEAED